VRRGPIINFLYVVFRKDIGRKTMALLLALILWVYLDQMVVVKQVHTLPFFFVQGENEFREVSTKNEKGFFFVLSQDVMLEKDPDESELKVHLSGPKELVQTTLIGRLDVRMSDLGGETKNDKEVFFIREYFNALMDKKSIFVEKFEQKTITLRLTRKRSAAISLSRKNLEISGIEDLEARGLSIEEDKIRFEPNTLPIEGPADQIALIDRDNSLLKLESMDVKSATMAGISSPLRLSKEMLDKKISIRSSDREVHVNVYIQGKKEARVLGVDVRVYFRGEPLELSQRSRIVVESYIQGAPQKVNIKFMGSRSQMELLGSDEALMRCVEPFIELEDVDRSGSFTFEEIVSKLPAIPDLRLWIDPIAIDRSIKVDLEQRSIRVKEKD